MAKRIGTLLEPLRNLLTWDRRVEIRD